MKVVDVNLLIYAVDEDCSQHRVVSTWWDRALAGEEKVGLCWTALSGFIRILTRSTSVETPVALDSVLEVVEDWLEHPNTQIVFPASNHWSLFRSLLRENGRAGKLTTDAHLAAIAIGNGASLVSCDRDFARFSKLRWENPLATT